MKILIERKEDGGLTVKVEDVHPTELLGAIGILMSNMAVQVTKSELREAIEVTLDVVETGENLINFFANEILLTKS